MSSETSMYNTRPEAPHDPQLSDPKTIAIVVASVLLCLAVFWLIHRVINKHSLLAARVTQPFGFVRVKCGKVRGWGERGV